MSENANLYDRYSNLNRNSPSKDKQELTNGIVKDIKSRLEKFKQNKKNDASLNQVNDLTNIDISKDLLEKFKKKNAFAIEENFRYEDKSRDKFDNFNSNLNRIPGETDKKSLNINSDEFHSENTKKEANGNANDSNIPNYIKKEMNSKKELKSFLSKESIDNSNDVSRDINKEKNKASEKKEIFFNNNYNNKLNNINNFLNNQPINSNVNNTNQINLNDAKNYQNLNSTSHYLSGNTITPNVFGQNYIENNFNKNQNKESSSVNNNNLQTISKINDLSILNNYNTLVPEKDKLDNSFRDLRDLGKSRVNSRLENLKEQYEIISSNKFPKEEPDTSTSIIKEKINSRSTNISSVIQSNLANNNISFNNNYDNNNNKINNNANKYNFYDNKISIITPASKRDCGVYDSNFVLKHDKKSFLLNEQALNKRTNSGDKKEKIEEKRNMILDTLNVGIPNSKRNQSSNKLNEKTDLNDRLKQNQNKIKDKIQNFVFELDNLSNTQQAPHFQDNRNSTNLSTILERNSNRNSLLNIGISNISNFNSNNFTSNLNNTIKSNSNTLKKNIPMPSKSIFSNPIYDTLNKNESKFNSMSTKNNNLGINYNIGGLSNNSFVLKFDEEILKFKKEDIRNLANKLRFSSQEDIKKMDDGLIEELLSLAKTIEKVFKDLNVSNCDTKL